MNYKLETMGGDSFNRVADKAVIIAAGEDMTVEFEFNGVTCLVNPDTNTELLYRDYSNSWLMGWKTVGPNCLQEYPPEVQSELNEKKRARDEEAAQQQIEYEAKEKREIAEFELKVLGVTLDIVNQELWDKGKAKNSDPYGGGVYKYAEGWAKLMQKEISLGKTVAECAERTSYELGFLGITGFMYGCAVQVLSKCWKHGEALRKWHNKEYNHEGEGVVNPAVLTINPK